MNFRLAEVIFNTMEGVVAQWEIIPPFCQPWFKGMMKYLCKKNPFEVFHRVIVSIDTLKNVARYEYCASMAQVNLLTKRYIKELLFCQILRQLQFYRNQDAMVRALDRENSSDVHRYQH